MWFQISCTPSHNGIRAPGLGSKEGAVAPAWTGHSRRRQQRSMYVHNLALHSCTHDRPRSISASTAAARHWRSSNRRLRSTCTLFCTISSRQQEPFAERPRLIRWPTSCATTAHMRNTPLPTSTDGVFMLSCGKPYRYLIQEKTWPAVHSCSRNGWGQETTWHYAGRSPKGYM